MNQSKPSRIVLTLCLILGATVSFVACSAGAESALLTDQSTNQRSDEPPFAGGGSEPGSGGGQSQPGDPGVGGDQPITSDPIDVPPIGPGADGALPVQPEPGIVDARPHAWDQIDVAADGRTITIYYWGGVETCYGLARVDASVGADGLLHVTVFEGQRGNLGPNVACIEIAVLKSVTVTLDQTIIAPAE